MIGGVTRHGRTARDARYLAAHLLKEPDARVELMNSAAPDLPAVLEDMQLGRDGTRADSAFLHIHLSPSRSMSDAEIRRASEIVRRHLGADDHPAALVFHAKERIGGDGNRHGHLVLGRVGPEGDVLPSGFEKMRLETAVRIAEFELGEPPTLGRHHASAVRWLSRNGRQDVADWLAAAHGPNPDKPTSAASPDKRQALARQGIALADVRETVRSAWSRSDSATAFRAALAEAGFEVAPGNKVGVYVVQRDGQTVGSLDRLAKQKRAAVAARMKEESNAGTAEIESDASPSGNVRRSEGRQGSRREIGALAGPAGAERGRSAGRTERHLGGDPRSPEQDARSPRGTVRQARRGDIALAERQLSRLRLSADARRNLSAIRQATRASGHDKIHAHQLGRMDWSHALRQAHSLGRDFRRLLEDIRNPVVPAKPARVNLATVPGPTPLSERDALRAELRAEMSGRQHLDARTSPSEGSKEIFRAVGRTKNQGLSGNSLTPWRASGSKNPAASRDELRAELRRAQASGRKRRRRDDEDEDEEFNEFTGPKM